MRVPVSERLVGKDFTDAIWCDLLGASRHLQASGFKLHGCDGLLLYLDHDRMKTSKFATHSEFMLVL